MKTLLTFILIILFLTKVFAQNYAYDLLNINRVNARINNNGFLYCDSQWNSRYEVPKGSGINAISSFCLWFGGLDTINRIHIAANNYNLYEFWPGPISDWIIYPDPYDSIWNRLWKINKADIEYHKSHFGMAGYLIPNAILTWPGNGDTSLGQAAKLAPFFDQNSNGIYEPMLGDYPLIKGDQAVFFIVNDLRKPHAGGGNQIGTEIHVMAYAYDCPEDSALSYSTFLHYDIYNRSRNTFHDCYLGIDVDPDLGFAMDDYIGCDVKRASFYCYNGKTIDGYGSHDSYGAFPPAIATTILGGPYLDSDNRDNPIFDTLGNPVCDFSVNGSNFGDGIMDNERFGITAFVGIKDWTWVPETYQGFYNSLKGLWFNGWHMKYGGDGHYTGTTTMDCNFLFPDLSDFCNWGTSGVQPPAYMTGFGGTGISWTENNMHNSPEDRKGIMGMGPFTFHPDEHQELDVAIIWARQYNDTAARAVIPLLKTRIDQIKSYFLHDSTPCGGSFSGIKTVINSKINLMIFPNPATSVLNVKYKSNNGDVDYYIYNILGENTVHGKLLNNEITTISLEKMSAGLYFVGVKDGNKLNTFKFIKQ